MLRYLLDTNIVIYVLKRRPVEVLSMLIRLVPIGRFCFH